MKISSYRIMDDTKFRRILQGGYQLMSIYYNLNLDLLLNLLLESFKFIFEFVWFSILFK